MAITGLFTRNRPKIGNLYFDALLEESSELRTDVSEFPLEDANTAHDNAVTRALALTMIIGVSDNWFRELLAQQDRLAPVCIPAAWDHNRAQPVRKIYSSNCVNYSVHIRRSN
ncbi:TPA: hypothetical protein ACPY8E_003754 [Yersinia enterocolitica]|uniref:hypothetical protein n=1 Tax=Yersinia enterocolitica TaxID=630 RepID=UPI0005E9131D|nr:hypothetical protein [Yersinia enterocolitica]CNB61057.1 Uncharacterised protein [Yersinia enterocolitica]CQH17029.1 Uncharacterised protein [Yersinia enterocolitica]